MTGKREGRAVGAGEAEGDQGGQEGNLRTRRRLAAVTRGYRLMKFSGERAALGRRPGVEKMEKFSVGQRSLASLRSQDRARQQGFNRDRL